MDFTLSDDQELLRDTARSLFSKECPTSLVRAHADDPSVADGLDKRLREFAGLADAPLADLCLFLEEAGAALAPGRFFATTALFAPLLRAIEHPLLAAAFLSRLFQEADEFGAFPASAIGGIGPIFENF